MAECEHNCETCGAACAERERPFAAEANAGSDVKKVIGVVSGKGGVGKSLVTALLAVAARRAGKKVAILDADITGPSIPKMFGLRDRAEATEAGILPSLTKTGIRVMSLNLLLDNEDDPVVWRGPIIAGTVRQFWTDVAWGDIDVMFVDMPPGTGDVPLTVFQSLPVDGIVVVTTPQQLVRMIVQKAARMAEMMNVPILGLVENMSYVECPDCGRRISVFGGGAADETAQSLAIPHLARMPIDPRLSAACDRGAIELTDGAWLDGLAGSIL
ncbi:MAG: Mrp/NBP35 family ATP-binding protein [Clostridiales bacterium]|nr:Mrp/NBP35 family ATP-binding protein [Clostridiales bacterium]